MEKRFTVVYYAKGGSRPICAVVTTKELKNMSNDDRFRIAVVREVERK